VVLVHVLGIVARNPQLRRVELAFAAFNSGEWSTWIAMLVYAYAQGGATESGIVAAAVLVPAALLAPVLATLGERHTPGRALLAGYVAQATTCVAVAVVLFARATPLLAYVLMAGPSVAFAMTRPTQAAFAPSLARTPEQLTATNVVSGWIESLSMLAAPIATGVILAVSSPGMVFLVMGIGCAVGGLLVTPLRGAVPAARRDDEDGDADTGSFAGGIALLGRDPHARMLVLLLGAQCIALGALDVLYVEIAEGVLHRGGSWAGYLSGAFGAGGVLAVAVTASLVGRPRLARPFVLSLGIWSLVFFGLAALPGAVAALALLAVAGGARSTFDVTGRTLLQRVARPDLLARVFGLLEGLQMAGLAVGSALAPLLISLGGPNAALIGVGLILPLIAVAEGRRLLDIDRHATVPVVEIGLLRHMDLFAALPGPTVESLARALEPLTVPAGTDVIVEGEEGDRFYAIADGQVDVLSNGRTVASLGRGDGFGEIALMYDVPRTATVTTRTESHLLSLERSVFLVALTGHAATHLAAGKMVEQRLEELRRAHGYTD
jgi:MFS family permease